MCFSVKLEPIIKSNLDVETGEYFAFPALHVFLGLTNKLCELLESVWPDFHLWTGSLHLEREAYHNRCFEVQDALKKQGQHLTFK